MKINVFYKGKVFGGSRVIAARFRRVLGVIHCFPNNQVGPCPIVNKKFPGNVTFLRGKKSGIYFIRRKQKSANDMLFQYLYKEVPPEQRDDEDIERYSTKIRERTSNLMWALKEDFLELSEVLASLRVTPKYRSRYRDTSQAITRICEALSAYLKHKDLVY